MIAWPFFLRQCLKPGGKVHLHQLTSDVEIADESLSLPGRASVVKHVPVRTDLLEALADTGYQQIALTRFGMTPCFDINGAELRETMIEARSAAESYCDNRFDVVHKGPFASIQDDEGHTYPRGERVSICDNTWSALETAGVAGFFTRIPARSGPAINCGVSPVS